MKRKLPPFLWRYFWDTLPEELDIREHSYFIIERLAEYGDLQAYRWLFATYSAEEIKYVIKQSRNISRKTATMWANYYLIPKDEIRCLLKSSMKTDDLFWPY